MNNQMLDLTIKKLIELYPELELELPRLGGVFRTWISGL